MNDVVANIITEFVINSVANSFNAGGTDVLTFIKDIWISSAQIEETRRSANFAFYGSIAATVVAFLSMILNFFINKNSIYKGIVTAERTKWINGLREDVSDFINIANEVYYCKKESLLTGQEEHSEVWRKRLNEINKKYLMVFLRLNPTEIETTDKFKKIMDTIIAFGREESQCDFQRKNNIQVRSQESLQQYIEEQSDIITEGISDLTNHMRKFFKSEWELVKDEADTSIFKWKKIKAFLKRCHKNS